MAKSRLIPPAEDYDLIPRGREAAVSKDEARTVASLFETHSCGVLLRTRSDSVAVGITLLGLVLLALPASAALTPAAAQSANDCAPYCDYRHYYGVQNYTWDAPGRFCRPICDAAGNCLPTKTCVRVEPRTRVVGGGVGPVTAIAGNTSVTFYDPSIATEPVARPLRSPPRGRAPIVRVRPYVPPR